MVEFNMKLRGWEKNYDKLEDFFHDFGDQITDALEFSIEEIIISAKEENPPASFTDRTGNLRASIGATNRKEIKASAKGNKKATVVIDGQEYLAAAMTGKGRVKDKGNKFIGSIRATMEYAQQVESKKSFLVRNIRKHTNSMQKNFDEVITHYIKEKFGD